MCCIVFRCSGRVFEAEKQIAKGSFYHKKCFTCNNCKHGLDASNFANGPDGEVYCLYCYRVSVCTLQSRVKLFLLSSEN